MDIKKAETSSCLSAIRGLRTTLESNKQQETYADMKTRLHEQAKMQSYPIGIY